MGRAAYSLALRRLLPIAFFLGGGGRILPVLSTAKEVGRKHYHRSTASSLSSLHSTLRWDWSSCSHCLCMMHDMITRTIKNIITLQVKYRYNVYFPLLILVLSPSCLCVCVVFQVFGFDVPEKLGDVPAKVLNPRDAWSDKSAYDETQNKLAGMFKNNFTKFVKVCPAWIHTYSVGQSN